MPDVQNPVAQPLGGATLDGTKITVDTYVNPPTIIPQIIRSLVAENEGYFAEEIFATPGMTVEGGAIIYTDSLPNDHFLDPNQSIAPRAPGAEAARIGSLRRPPKVARPESWAGSIEVTDEARRRNDVIAVRKEFTAAANTFADRIQTRAIETLNTAVTAWNRVVTSTVNWRQAYTNGIPNANPASLPQADFALVMNQFIADRAGVRPDTVILHQNDSLYLDLIYGDKVQALLDAYGLRRRVTPQATEGSPLFIKAGAPGTMAFEKALDQEYTREGKRFTDVFTLEAVPVLVAHDASAVLALQGVND